MPRSTGLFRFGLVGLLVCSHLSPVSAEIYKWVDENGITHYSAKPPEGQKSKRMELSAPAARKQSIALPPGVKLKQPSYEVEKPTKKSRLSGGGAITGGYGSVQPIPDKVHENSPMRAIDPDSYPRIKDSLLKRIPDKTEASYRRIMQNNLYVGANLAGKDFSEALLVRIDFSAANLNGASFRGSKCVDCKFNRANLTGADFEQTRLLNVSFTGANLKNTRFSVAHWANLDFIGSRNLDYKKLYRAVSKNSASASNLTYQYNGCQLGVFGADCRAANLSGHQVFATDIRGIDFSGAKLDGADFSLSRIAGSDFTDADLVATRFGKIVYKSKFNNADLTNADFSDSLLVDVDFSNARLKNLRLVAERTDPELLLSTEANNCEICAQVLGEIVIDFDRFKQQIASYSSIVPNNDIFSGAVERSFREDYARFIRDTGHLSVEQSIELIHAVLKSEEPAMIYDVVKMIDEKMTSARRKAVCRNPRIVDAMLPLITVSSPVFDARVKEKFNDYTPSEYMRRKSIGCMSNNLRGNEKVDRAFAQALQGEAKDNVRWYLVEVHKTRPRQLENLILDALAKRHTTTARQAAHFYMGGNREPSPRLREPVLTYLTQQDRSHMTFYSLLKDYKPSRDLIVDLLDVREFRKRKRWNTKAIDDVIQHHQGK